MTVRASLVMRSSRSSRDSVILGAADVKTAEANVWSRRALNLSSAEDLRHATAKSVSSKSSVVPLTWRN